MTLCCIVCNVPKSKLCPLSGNKSQKCNYVDKLIKFVGEPLDTTILFTRVICSTCASLLDNYLPYKNNIIKSCSDQKNGKRSAETPPSTLRQSVADQIKTSVEKLKKLSLGSRKRICFPDHSYSSTSKDSASSSSACEDMCVLDPTVVLSFDEKHVLQKQIEEEVCICQQDSVLVNFKDVGSLCDKQMFHLIINEMQRKCPKLLSVLTGAISKKENSERVLATIGTIYGMLMHSHCNKASAVQKMYSSLAIRYHADNELMSRLNKVHIMMSSESKRNIIAEFGENLEDKLIRDVSDGKNGKINGDNVDIRVHTNDIRMANRNKDYHFFASDFILDRVDVSSLSGTPNNTDPMVHNFIPSVDETVCYRNSLKILLSRVLIEYIPAFSWMRKLSALPNHIPHPLEEEMAQKSTVHMLPVSLNNEVSYEGCIHIMDEYVKMVNHWYAKAGRGCELDELQIPVGGDQLTRCRLQGAKSLRAGAHTKQERFEQLYPVIIELFHTLQDFLEKLCKKFLKLSYCRNVATLAHLKLIIQRINVNGQVKARFKAHEDFVVLVGQAYFLAFVLEKFGMKTLDDTPKHDSIPSNIHLQHQHHKEEVANRVLDEIVKDIFIPFEMKNQTTCKLELAMGTWKSEIESTVHDDKVKVNVVIDEANLVLDIPTATVQKGCAVKLAGIANPLFIKEKSSKPVISTDALQDYVTNFLQWYFVVIQIQDAIHEGDVVRTNIIMKYMIPFFYSHSSLSKYFSECIDYILKTEFTLPPDYSMRVRAASFVNVHGGRGQNKAADMHKENEVKLLKELIKGLGANKSEQSIVAISKAAPVVAAVVDNFDKMLDIKVIHSSHRKRSSADDMSAIVRVLQNVGLWKSGRVRSLDGFKDVKRSPFAIDQGHLFLTIQRTIARLQRDLPDVGNDESDIDSNEDSETEQ